jgi:hypothetical protein
MDSGCPYDPLTNCDPMQNAVCQAECASRAPNGCDCFGCCITQDGMARFLPAIDCDLANPDTCPPCTPTPGCLNPCNDDCEVCFGQNVNDLPPTCTQPWCPGGVSSCASSVDCPPGAYCQTGCCVTPL